MQVRIIRFAVTPTSSMIEFGTQWLICSLDHHNHAARTHGQSRTWIVSLIMLFSHDATFAKFGDEYEHTDWMVDTYAKMKAGILTSAEVISPFILSLNLLLQRGTVGDWWHSGTSVRFVAFCLSTYSNPHFWSTTNAALNRHRFCHYCRSGILPMTKELWWYVKFLLIRMDAWCPYTGCTIYIMCVCGIVALATRSRWTGCNWQSRRAIWYDAQRCICGRSRWRSPETDWRLQGAQHQSYVSTSCDKDSWIVNAWRRHIVLTTVLDGPYRFCELLVHLYWNLMRIWSFLFSWHLVRDFFYSNNFNFYFCFTHRSLGLLILCRLTSLRLWELLRI